MNIIPFSVGVFGDAILQIIVNNSKLDNKWGLKSYFKKHGSFESLFIAGGMLHTFTLMYLSIDPTFNTIGLIIYGSLLDICFRYFYLFPSLNDYYKSNSSIITTFWGYFPFILIKLLLF